jgi:hypothetical protein
VRHFSAFCTSNGSHSNRVTVTPDRARVVRRDGVHLGLPGQHAGPDTDDQGRPGQRHLAAPGGARDPHRVCCVDVSGDLRLEGWEPWSQRCVCCRSVDGHVRVYDIRAGRLRTDFIGCMSRLSCSLWGRGGRAAVSSVWVQRCGSRLRCCAKVPPAASKPQNVCRGSMCDEIVKSCSSYVLGVQ